MPNPPLRIEKPVYGGDGLARQPDGKVVLLPFTLPGEIVDQGAVSAQLTLLQPSPDRVEPRCIHFGVCGGCQYQMASYPAQLRFKKDILAETLERAGAQELPDAQVHGSPEPWAYRNRIRLRVRTVNGGSRLGYSIRGTKDFLPVQMCPISASVLWSTAEALLHAAAHDRNAAEWLAAAAEVEIACDDTASRVQLHLLCTGAVPQRKNSFEQFTSALKAAGAAVVSAGASRLHTASGRATAELAQWGRDGIGYRVDPDRFWLQRGSFFQVNRFLVPAMVQLVCGERRGRLAWDLYAGVGLFSRPLTRQFEAVTAVEANPLAVTELRRGLVRPTDQAVEETTLAFLRQAVVQRERPDLVVLDPPRAGAGEEACALLSRLAPAEIVYVSCDPTTLARDLSVLSPAYRVSELHMVDLFPQSYHLETVMVLRRRDVQGLP